MVGGTWTNARKQEKETRSVDKPRLIVKLQLPTHAENSSEAEPIQPTPAGENIHAHSSSEAAEAAVRVADAKFNRDPDSLTTYELKTLLRAAGKPVVGLKADLLARLSNEE